MNATEVTNKCTTNQPKSRSATDRKKEHFKTQDSAAKKLVTVICGDSIIKHVHGWKLTENKKVVVKCFPGATVEDMEDFIKPIIRKKPENIIHTLGPTM